MAVHEPNAERDAPDHADQDAAHDEVRAAPDPDDPEARLYTSEPLEDEDGNTYVVQQQNVGPDNERGGGEWPDPDTSPQSPAPGAE
jgi:hypothetical protein